MTITEVTENKTRQPVGQLIKKPVYDRCYLELLRFFVAHPNSRFNKLAVVHAIDENGSRIRVEKALTQLIEEGVIKTNSENNTRLYLLTKDEAVRQMVLSLVKLDYLQWQILRGR